ncbi:hypothetical protein FC748_03110 [Lysinibacillus tabacifolii]|uniref:Pre-toxin TG domain-containing protein n=1 Tax=Lysinibacillus tabacifolii TaxID=1173107 RepID=A0ABY2T2J4_9BACI|nr:hypothetical protein FC748_03110 [Lysinibacillus tabacifolii]
MKKAKKGAKAALLAVKNTCQKVKQKTKEVYNQAKQKTKEVYSQAKQKTKEVYNQAKQKTKEVYSQAKQQIKTTVNQTKHVMKEKVLPTMKKGAKAAGKALVSTVTPKNMLDTLQLGLDVVGLVPGVGEIADGLNAVIYYARGDKLNAALSVGAMIPFAGMAVTGGKLVTKGAKAFNGVVDGIKTVTNKGPIGELKEKATKKLDTVKDKFQTKVAEVKDQLRQLGTPQLELAGVNVGRITDTGTVGKNKPSPTPKPSNRQNSTLVDSTSNKKPNNASSPNNTSKSPPEKQRQDVKTEQITIKKYGEWKKDGSGKQKHHLNQDAAFKKNGTGKEVIPSNEGYTIELEGNAFKDVGSPHFMAHKTMEEFFNRYRKGDKKGTIPTNAEYNIALYKSLRKAGIEEKHALEAINKAREQRIEYNLKDDDFIPRIPGQINSLKKYQYKHIKLKR